MRSWRRAGKYGAAYDAVRQFAGWAGVDDGSRSAFFQYEGRLPGKGSSGSGNADYPFVISAWRTLAISFLSISTCV